ncbi:CG31200, partial [Drosophila busckii]
NYKCLAVLISEQHLLAPAHCFNEAMLEDQPLRHVLLGDWNPTNPFMQPDCSAQTNCAAIPQLFSIAEVIIHPDYQASTLLNNIALLKLTHALDFSESIRAICLPPYRGSSTSYAHFAQFLSYAGFAVDKSLPFKLKGLMHVAGTSACKRKLRNLNYITASRDSPLNHICANSNLDAQIFTGAPLMDVQVRDSEPSNYYLVGLLVGPDRYTGSETVNLFMRIQPHREWIEYNML